MITWDSTSKWNCTDRTCFSRQRHGLCLHAVIPSFEDVPTMFANRFYAKKVSAYSCESCCFKGVGVRHNTGMPVTLEAVLNPVSLTRQQTNSICSKGRTLVPQSKMPRSMVTTFQATKFRAAVKSALHAWNRTKYFFFLFYQSTCSFFSHKCRRVAVKKKKETRVCWRHVFRRWSTFVLVVGSVVRGACRGSSLAQCVLVFCRFLLCLSRTVLDALEPSFQ